MTGSWTPAAVTGEEAAAVADVTGEEAVAAETDEAPAVTTGAPLVFLAALGIFCL